MQDYVNSMKYKSIMNYNGSAKPIACVDSLTEDNPLISNENVHTFLENDIRNLKRETWSKLDKATKLQKLRVYMAKEVEDSNTTQMEADLLYGYFRSCLEKKKTPSARTVEYNIQTGKVVSIKDVVVGTKSKAQTAKKKSKPVVSNSSVGGSGASADCRKKTKTLKKTDASSLPQHSAPTLPPPRLQVESPPPPPPPSSSPPRESREGEGVPYPTHK